MKQFIAGIFPPTIFKKRAQYAALAAGFWTIIIMLAQLFRFEKFPKTLEPLGIGGGTIAAIAIVLLEFISLPFLLSMSRLGRLGRRISGACTLLAPGVWLMISAAVLMSGGQGKVSLFGAVAALPGVVSLLLSGAWLAAVAYLTAKLRRLDLK
ncbi:hypothetical protein HG431_004140 [Candidatus Saccharibacteria bacterium]|nr:hypothetical protein [Candidatus Saccharibacteria bacterium]